MAECIDLIPLVPAVRLPHVARVKVWVEVLVAIRIGRIHPVVVATVEHPKQAICSRWREHGLVVRSPSLDAGGPVAIKADEEASFVASQIPADLCLDMLRLTMVGPVGRGLTLTSTAPP